MASNTINIILGKKKATNIPTQSEHNHPNPYLNKNELRRLPFITIVTFQKFNLSIYIIWEF